MRVKLPQPEYVYAWGPRMRGFDAAHDRKWNERKGSRCKLIARGSMNSALVEFADGERAVVSRNALRKPRRPSGETAGEETEIGAFI